MMSNRAYNGLTKKHRDIMESHYKILKSDISTIENIGGGSARCMVAEIFWTKYILINQKLKICKFMNQKI